eukprot:9628757-Karenia_brevis.AAC.1
MASGRDVSNYINMDVDAIIDDIFGHRTTPEDNAVDIHDMTDSVWNLASVIHQRHVDIGGLELTPTDQSQKDTR